MQVSDPDKRQQAMSQADEQSKNGRHAEAEATYRRIIASTPDFDPAYHALGLLAFTVGKPSLAVELIQHAIELNDSVPLYLNNLCEILRRQGRLEEALESGKKATGIAPGNAAFHYNFALVQADKLLWADAIASYRRVLQLDAQHGMAWNNLGAALEKTQDIDGAMQAYKEAIAINPAHAEAQNNLGAIYSEQGLLDEARACFADSIKAQADFIEPYYNLSSLKTFTVNDPHFSKLRKMQSEAGKLTQDQQIRYFFTLGKAYEDIAEYSSAFTAYQRANTLKFSQLHYKEANTDKLLERIKTIFSPGLLHENCGQGSDDETPVFIVGMPRSGTSLIEQILSSHSSVYGAGELSDLNEVILSSQPDLQENRIMMQLREGLPGFDFAYMAGNYLQRLRSHDTEALRITDKMPANFFYIGFIHLLFPKAKIIHARRDPMDSCFSCYSRLFNETMDFTYDLTTLGNYYVRYIKLMQLWHELLPQGRILDVNYEDMVADTETQVRRILDHVELPWEEKCLAFHENKRQVKTASVAQVRQPIYSSSVARWQHFDEYLSPLLNIVGPYR